MGCAAITVDTQTKTSLSANTHACLSYPGLSFFGLRYADARLASGILALGRPLTSFMRNPPRVKRAAMMCSSSGGGAGERDQARNRTLPRIDPAGSATYVHYPLVLYFYALPSDYESPCTTSKNRINYTWLYTPYYRLLLVYTGPRRPGLPLQTLMHQVI